MRCQIVLLAIVSSVGFSSAVTAQPSMSVTRIASGISRPVFATTAPGDPNRFFIVEQHTGRIEIFNLSTNTFNAAPFLDLSGLATGNEQGFLGLAFHPDYQNNGLFYVNLTTSSGGGDTAVREYARQTADVADASSIRTLMTFNQPFPNHNAGWMGFGPDGFLYIATGDGGSGGDPQNNAQTITNNLLGKILRIDPQGNNSSNGQYGNPAGNPFVGVTGDDEIWCYGLRNPWRCSFDRQTGDFYIADVGQGAREEIDVQPAASTGGENYGWRVREGTNGPPFPGAIDPIYDYAHGGGNLEGFSVTGGYVYRGPLQMIHGHYFFADYVTDRVWSMRWDGSDPSTHNGTNYTEFIDWSDEITTNIGTVANISSFAEDSVGNLYILDLNGEIFRVDSVSLPVVSEGMKLNDGVHAGGQMSDLFASDNVYLELDPSPTKNLLKQKINLILQSTCAIPTPNGLAFRLESKMIGWPTAGDVIQTVELLNYQTGAYELLDTRAANVTDEVVTVQVTGDPSRFVQAGTREMTTSINWKSESFSGKMFTWSIDVDEAVWIVTE